MTIPSYCRQDGQEVQCQRHHLHLLRSRLRHVVRKGQEGRSVSPPAGWDLLDALPGEDVREQARRDLRGLRFDGADLHGGGSNVLVSKKFFSPFSALKRVADALSAAAQRIARAHSSTLLRQRSVSSPGPVRPDTIPTAVSLRPRFSAACHQT